jgi:hypothetical protein
VSIKKENLLLAESFSAAQASHEKRICLKGYADGMTGQTLWHRFVTLLLADEAS